jgi:hypothetical protein
VRQRPRASRLREPTGGYLPGMLTILLIILLILLLTGGIGYSRRGRRL